MPSVREATYGLLRRHGMTTMFGNPGSTELPMLKEFPEDFHYVLALQEAVAVGMADGYAQASGTVGHVNLHTAPGVGNGIGGIFNAQANKAPLLVTAGQQARSLMTLEANLTNRDAARMPHPLVKWSYEPPRAEDVPHAIARATHLAALPPRQRLPVWATPAPGGGRIGFPEDHPAFQGILPPAIGPLAEILTGHDLIVVVGSSVFPYYPNIPGRLLPEGAALVAITSDGDEPVPESDPMSPSTAATVLAEVWPDGGVLVLESPSSTLAIRNQLRLSQPG